MNLETLRSRLKTREPKRILLPRAAHAAVALIIGPAPDGFEALFIRRAEHPKDPWSGQVGLPGGRREPNDPDLLATAIRETREEIGVSLNSRQLLGELDDVHPSGGGLPSVTVRPFVFLASARPRVLPSAEVAGHFWTSLKALRDSHRRTEIDARGTPRQVSAYCVGPNVIWGITRRILEPFVDLALGE